MSRQLFELLKRERLDTPDRIERGIMHDRTVTQVRDLYEQLSEAVLDCQPLTGRAGGPFDFLPNSDIAAHERGSCDEWSCRLQRVDRLVRFAALWADSLVLPSYFADCAEHSPERDEMSFRYAVAGNLKVLLALEPLLEEGMVRFVDTAQHFCPSCGHRISDELSAAAGIERAVRRLHRTSLQNAMVRFESDPTAPADHRFLVEIRGPEDLIPHGGALFMMGELPEWLPKRVAERAASGHSVEHLVPPTKVHRVRQLMYLLTEVADEIVNQHVISSAVGTRYLTNRQVDAVFLQALGEDPEHERLNRILGQYLSYEMPIIESVPLNDLLRVRRDDRDAFLVYRDTLKRVIDEHVATGRRLSGTEAKQLFEDVVRPNLNKMDAKVASIRNTAGRKLARDVAVTGTVLSAGLFSGLVPAEMVGLLSALGGLGVAKELVNSLSSRLGTPDELRAQDFYFLWRVRRRARRPRPS